MMKGKNMLWGTAVFLVSIVATYNRKSTTLSADEDQRYGEAREAASNNPAKWRGERISAAKAAGHEIEAEFEKTFVAKDWVR